MMNQPGTNGKTPAAFDLEEYLNGGVRGIVRDAVRSALRNRRESLYLAQYARACGLAEKRRAELARQGEHIPPFLIASITGRCNLSCTGCYARAGKACGESEPEGLLSAGEWGRIFAEAEELGVSFILLAGGEPLMRPDVLLQAAARPHILFPVFTNGTLFGENELALFDVHRNLLPVFSLEGGREETDARRGDGVFEKLRSVIKRFREKGVFWAASVTITRQNILQVTGQEFLAALRDGGCKAIFFVEYVPVQQGTEELALSEGQRRYMAERLRTLRERKGSMILLSFPGDEAAAGGCLAAGRGFFHINARGGAEPCPFSPYSDTSLAGMPLRKALYSPLFRQLGGGLMQEDHEGGCALFARRQEVERLLDVSTRQPG